MPRRTEHSSDAPPERPSDPDLRRANLRRALGLFKPYGLRLGTVGALIAFSAALGALSPFLLRDILDDALPRRDDALLTLLAGGMVAIAIVT
ncbi:MAG: ABC transporter ATP-binding protein, partial [Thermoleophilia bacterium]|nr:ABC transporter ATP-binding protein [Thermoleophilia bacterium]